MARYRELTSALHRSDELMGFCHTQLHDTEEETNGPPNAAHSPKIVTDLLRAITRGNRT